ncbi:malto-oligosyltrehalose trehalohydrolase [Pedobacter sp. HMF7647]|uniref:Malto-oligosyltrehalose trehalohydrolase n=1 Tax=Hufsiella arboris TaxID=2695275 RepID=A0A7K1YAX0_9SPHI|nr:malto-oligosyltrehalose trehalohydrolase [Hufsiella arboris]MXV51491.1 malto-oligosyltrehalose trehalohydrolase [Hufsiella arboris]
MKTIDIEKRSIGVNFQEDGKAVVRVWAPSADKLDLLIVQTGEVVSLNKREFGYWQVTTDRLNAGDKYCFLIDGKIKRPDPASLSQPDGVHESSQAVSLKEFNWTDTGWTNPPLGDYIFYELHTGVFSPEGTFSGIEEKLDYLLELGITAIEIMPVAQFPGNRNWGYDGVFPFAVQNSYGGPNGLRHLINACHNKGVAVVLDVVYNHMGPEGNYFDSFGPYFTDKYNTPWGSAINVDDAWCDGVREYFIENALMWFRDFHVDALRLDAVHAIKDLSATHILREIKENVDALMKQSSRKHHLIVELDLNDHRFIDPVKNCGYGMDAQWIDEFHHALRVAAGGDTNGYYSDFDGINHLAKAYRDAYVFDGMYSPHRKKIFGSKTGNPGWQFIVFSQNHDQVGNRMLGERSSQLFSFETQKLLAGAIIVSPFLPMFFMGEEWSEPNPFLYFVSHTDPELAEAVRKGRKEEFSDFHSAGEVPDPMAEGTFLKSKLQWGLLDKPDHERMFKYYQALISLRKNNQVLKKCNRDNLEVVADPENQLLLLERWEGEHRLFCALNFSKQRRTAVIPPSEKDWNKLISSSDKQWGGFEDSPEITIGNANLEVSPESVVIYFNNHV